MLALRVKGEKSKVSIVSNGTDKPAGAKWRKNQIGDLGGIECDGNANPPVKHAGEKENARRGNERRGAAFKFGCEKKY